MERQTDLYSQKQNYSIETIPSAVVAAVCKQVIFVIVTGLELPIALELKEAVNVCSSCFSNQQ